MPAKQLPDELSFYRFVEFLLRRRFKQILRQEFQSSLNLLPFKAPSPREGREIGYSYAANGLEVIVWTTYVKSQGRARDVDAGWVLIREGNVPLYFSRPRSRTKNFLDNLFWDARLARYRVRNRPHCPFCDALMNIAQGRGLKSRYWKCDVLVHSKPVFLSWDHGLPQEALDYLKKTRKKRAKYRKQLREEGKEPGAAMKKRIGWKVTKPQNAVPQK